MPEQPRDRLHATGVDDEAGLQEALDALAARLQRSVAVDDPDIRLIAASRHFGDEDAARVRAVLGREVDDGIRELLRAEHIWRLSSPARVRLPRPGVKTRLCVPVRCAGLLLGFLWLIEDAELTEEQIADASEVADSIGLRLHRREVALERRRARLEILLRDLVSSDDATRADALQELREDELVREAEHVAVAVVGCRAPEGTAPSGQLPAALTRAADQVLRRQPECSTLVRVRRRGLVLLVAGRHPAAHRAEHVAGAVVEELTAAVGGRWTAGVSSADGGLPQARTAYEHAALASRAADSLPECGDVVTWEDLGVYGLLARLAPGGPDVSSCPAALLKLAHGRGAEQLLSTAETFLDLAGDVKNTAATLHIHRATLYQRLARIEQLSGLDFANGVDRLTLHLGIKLARLDGTYEQLITSAGKRPE